MAIGFTGGETGEGCGNNDAKGEEGGGAASDNEDVLGTMVGE